MALLKRDMENEMSGGQVFGYILVIGAVLFVVAFGVFVGLKKAGINTSRTNKETTAYIEESESLYEEDIEGR